MQAAAQDIYNAQQQAGGQPGAGFDPNAKQTRQIIKVAKTATMSKMQTLRKLK